jgi:hypothetical protein
MTEEEQHRLLTLFGEVVRTSARELNEVDLDLACLSLLCYRHAIRSYTWML